MKYGCIGEHLVHSFSAEIHAMFAPYEYELVEIPADKLSQFMEKRDFLGINVTIPYKQAVIPYLDGISETAKKIGAVNTITNKNGYLFGDNTDFYGMSALIGYTGLELRKKKVLIAGTGGTSLTAAAVAGAMGAARVIRAGRTSRENNLTYDDVYANYSDTEILINTAPCGMYPAIAGCAVDIKRLPKLEGVIDAVYNPLRTELVLNARSKNLPANGGLYMLVAQAVAASERFTGRKYPDSLIYDIYGKLLRSKENIVLTGMPGSGKSTVGRILSEKLGREFIDTDSIIEKTQGVSIKEIFASHGEGYFRELEEKVITDTAGKNGVIISTGGGAVLSVNNILRLRHNGRLFFLDRPPEQLIPTSDRPLAGDIQAIYKRYNERYAIYCSTADKIIRNEGTAASAADRIIYEITCNQRT